MQPAQLNVVVVVWGDGLDDYRRGKSLSFENKFSGVDVP